MSELLRRCPELAGVFDRGAGKTISLRYAEALFELVRHERPAFVIEIGMGFGASTLAILTALREHDGRLLSIDPSQASVWRDAGREAVERAGLEVNHEVVEDDDYRALPSLLAAGTRCSLAYIDGWHTFDHAFLDWWYIDKMLGPGGIVGFNDCGWPAVDKVIRFLLGHRRYTEVDVGLRKRYRGWRRSRQEQDRYFRKVDDWEPRWDHYSPF